MAQEAIMIGSDGKMKIVHAAELSDADRKNKFICSGITEHGVLCGCPMKPTNATPLRNPYFYESDDNMKHRPNCSNRREREKTIIKKLDRRGEDITTQILYERLNRDIVANPKKKTENSPTDDTSVIENMDGENKSKTDETPENDRGKKDHDREIQTKKRHPRNMDELAELLRSLPINAMYADHLVHDLILDERTVEGYKRVWNLPTGTPFIINARKAIPRDYGIYLDNEQWLLKDFWGGRNNAFLFILRVDAEAKRKLWNLCTITPAVKITILCVLKKHPSLQITYETELVKAHMITAEIVDDSN